MAHPHFSIIMLDKVHVIDGSIGMLKDSACLPRKTSKLNGCFSVLMRISYMLTILCSVSFYSYSFDYCCNLLIIFTTS